MDFPLNSSLNSSLVFALAVALWLLWVSPYFFRRPSAAAPSMAHTAAGPAANAIRPPASPDKGSQGIIMNTISTTPSGGGSTQVQGAQTGHPAEQAPAFTIRPGRTVLAAVGLLAVLAFVIGTVLAAFTAVSWLVPAFGLLGSAAVVAALRALAVRDRRRRVDNAFRAAMGPEPRQEGPVETPEPAELEPERETVLFDRESGAPSDETVAAGPVAAPRYTPDELRTEALNVAAATAAPRPSTTPWQPVELPKPVYVDAPRAERPAPEPIVLPETPQSQTKTPLRPPAAPAAPAEQARPETGKINLDDVLQRRRA